MDVEESSDDSDSESDEKGMKDSIWSPCHWCTLKCFVQQGELFIQWPYTKPTSTTERCAWGCCGG